MRRLPLVAAVGVLLAAGCESYEYRMWSSASPDLVRPTIAVMKFENRAGSPRGWNVGEGVKDILVDRLVATERFTVIERPELDAVLKELRFQQTGATREQRRAKLGRLKNVEYLIKGTITDFGHVSTDSSFFTWKDRLDLFGTGHRAVMSVTLYVVEVESGEIVASESITESVRAKDMNVKVAYQDVAFGGSVFHKTPLGRVTAKVINKSVQEIADVVAARPWQPKIAQVRGPRNVIINGGRNRAVRAGAEYEVMQLGEPIVDPDTGDVIGTSAGSVLARLRVRDVHPQYSVAVVTTGEAKDLRIGQKCCPAPPLPAAPTVRGTGRAPGPPGESTGRTFRAGGSVAMEAGAQR